MQPERNSSSEGFFRGIFNFVRDSFAPFGSFFAFIWELFKIAVVALAIVLPIRLYVIQPFYVKGASMEPNFHNSDYLIVYELGYRFKEPQRGDVVVFKYPKDPKEYFIKRVIGLPGERIVIDNNQIFIYNSQYPDGFQLTESYIPKSERIPRNVDVTLKGDEYFVLGDNRDNSMDSTMFGPVKRELIVGRVVFRGFPFDKIGVIGRVEYKE